MKKSLIKRLCKQYLLPELPTFSCKGDLLYSIESEYLLQGICFESSSFSSTSFSIEVFIQPLYLPSDNIYFNFGKRLGFLGKGYDYWWEYLEEDESEIMAEIKSIVMDKGLLYFSQCKNIYGFVDFNRNLSTDSNPTNVEALCYSLIMLNEFDEALSRMYPFINMLDQVIAEHPNITWSKTIHSRLQTMIDYLERKEFPMAISQLDMWKEYTLSTLKLS